ncbi:hypothetical protein HYE67_005342 [Fusarium culmorum]|uniref:Uncharacterized protein n=1 Tax=Fusarium culmorum TaxID=5516 RepID=A0A7S8D742_FUSCU|nr:hypothetical protein HYE67_005342 [Fusarium culmorum]
MSDDLDLAVGSRYSIALLLFFIPYMICEIPSNMLAYALSRISVGNGMFSEGWRWIFIIEEAVTITAGVAGPFLLAECCLQYYVVASSIYSLGYFLPLILRESLGFSYTKAQFLFSPPYIPSFPVVQAAIGIVGLLIILFVHAPYVRYFGVLLGVWGVRANVPVTLAYGANNAAGPAEKGIISAVMITAGAIGGITSSTIFRVQDAPRYLPGMGTTIAFPALYIILIAGMSHYIKRKNKEAGKNGTIIEGILGFRYAPQETFESIEARKDVVIALRRRGVIIGTTGDRSIRLHLMLIFQKKHADILLKALKEVTIV